MSVPIKYCFLVEAVESKEAFDKLHPIMYRNLRGGHFTVFGCEHEPQCRDLTDNEQRDLLSRFRQKPQKQLEGE